MNQRLSLGTSITVRHMPMMDVPRDKAGLLNDRPFIQVPIRQSRAIEYAFS